MTKTYIKSLLHFAGIVIFFMIGHIILSPILDDIGIPNFFLRDLLTGFLTAVLLLVFLGLLLSTGKALGWVNQSARLPWDD